MTFGPAVQAKRYVAAEFLGSAGQGSIQRRKHVVSPFVRSQFFQGPVVEAGKETFTDIYRVLQASRGFR